MLDVCVWLEWVEAGTMSLLLVYIIVLGYLGLTMYLANQAHLGRQIRDFHRQDETVTIYDMTYRQQFNVVRSLLYVGVFLISMLAMYLLMVGLALSGLENEDGEAVATISTGAVLIGVMLASASAFVGYRVVTSRDLRLRIAGWIGTQGSYDPDSVVHMTAIVFSLLILTAQIIQFIAIGGTEGLAESLEQGGIDPFWVVFQAVIQVMAAVLGVGAMIRRDWSQVLSRLGLRWPTGDDWRVGIGAGLLCFAGLIGFGMVMSLLFPDLLTDAARANDGLANAFDTLPLAFLLAASAGIGEEIFFRGALQPVFGNVAASAFFALLHTQSLLSPAVLLLFGISLVFGIVRQRQSTTAAIIAHFVYNFVQLSIALAVT